jgi:uncharacterized protein YbjT (DUF2867 family)
METFRMNYLITGATGDVGSLVTDQLLARGERPRVFVRNPEKARRRFRGRVDTFVGDLAEPLSLRPALAGVDALFLVTTGPSIPQLDEAVAAEAKAAGVRHLVKLSSLDVEQGLAIGAWHERGEAAIRAIGIPFTFVRPSGFLSNLLAWANSVRLDGVVRSSTGDGRRPFIDSRDIAAVSVQALTSGAYQGQVLSITGPEPLRFAEISARLGAAIGRKIRFEVISDAEAGRRFGASGASPAEVEAHVALWRAIREGRLGAVTDTVARVLGRPAVSFDQWLGENLAAFQ